MKNDEMISTTQIQNACNTFYKRFRDFIWGYPVIEAYAEVETQCYTAFPIKQDILNSLNKLKSLIRRELSEDEALKETFENLVDTVNKISKEPNVYYSLKKPGIV